MTKTVFVTKLGDAEKSVIVRSRGIRDAGTAVDGTQRILPGDSFLGYTYEEFMGMPEGKNVIEISEE